MRAALPTAGAMRCRSALQPHLACRFPGAPLLSAGSPALCVPRLLGAAAAAALGFGELQSVKEINNVLGTTLLLSSLICLTQGK